MIFVFILFIASFLTLAFFYLFVFSRLAFQSSNHRIIESSNHPVSVIICARNERENLTRFLPCILEQDYPEFEVIVVNDRSDDGTKDLLKDLSGKYSRLKIIDNFTADKKFPGKRNALKKGLEVAKHELILLTDADCRPASDQWIKLMASSLTPAPSPKDRGVRAASQSSEKKKNDVEIVLGISPCFEQRGFLNGLVRYENFLTALYYLSFTLAGKPYMGVGRNLLYRTSVTRNIEALEHHSGLISGDDDLTVNRIATKTNTALMLHPQAHVFTLPASTFREFVHQKRRHYSTGFHYRAEHKLALGALYGSQIIFNVSVIALLASCFMLLPAITIFILKNILQTLIYGKAMQKLNVHNLWIFTPVLDIGMSAFFLTLGGLSLFKTNTWK